MDASAILLTRREGGLPMGHAPDEWSYGDLDAGFKERRAGRRRNLRCPVHRPSADGNAQRDGLLAERRAVPARLDPERGANRRSTRVLARMDASNIVLVSEFCGGGFGSKGAGAISMVIPALLSKKAGAPVMMRISREEEHYIGRARTGMVGRAGPGSARMAASPRSISSSSKTTVRTGRWATTDPRRMPRR